MRAKPDFDFQLGESAEMIRDSVSRFADEQIAPLADRIDREDYFPRAELWAQMGELGLHGITVEEADDRSGLQKRCRWWGFKAVQRDSAAFGRAIEKTGRLIECSRPGSRGGLAGRRHSLRETCCGRSAAEKQATGSCSFAFLFELPARCFFWTDTLRRRRLRADRRQFGHCSAILSIQDGLAQIAWERRPELRHLGVVLRRRCQPLRYRYAIGVELFFSVLLRGRLRLSACDPENTAPTHCAEQRLRSSTKPQATSGQSRFC